MTHIFKNQAKRARHRARGGGRLRGARNRRPHRPRNFASATITLENAVYGSSLECSFRETGLTPGGQVRYDCTSQYVGVLQQCMLKNKAVGNSRLLHLPRIYIAEEVENFDVKRNGSDQTPQSLRNIPESGEANATHLHGSLRS